MAECHSKRDQGTQRHLVDRRAWAMRRASTSGSVSTAKRVIVFGRFAINTNNCGRIIKSACRNGAQPFANPNGTLTLLEISRKPMPRGMKLWNSLGSTRVRVQSAPTLRIAKPGTDRDRVVALAQSPVGWAARRRRDEAARGNTRKG
jgi:hypothetical protein